MNPSEFSNIERSLGIELPQSYKSLLASYPIGVSEDIKSHGLFADPNRVIQENIALRTEGWFRIDWPVSYFVIGDDGCGDYYFMVIGKDEKVYFADHECGSHPVDAVEECLSSDSLSKHFSRELELERDYVEYERAKRERHQNRKWWEIWK